MPTILTKKSDTPGAVPATANLTNAAGGAELAVNTADKRLFTINSSSAVVELGTNPGSLTCADASFTVARISSGTVTQLTSTSATVTTLTATSASVTNLTATSIVISNLSIASANVTTLTSTNATAASLTVSTGNLTFSSTAQRITGDMSNATIGNRLAFQTSTTNSSTIIETIPNGTGTGVNYNARNSSDMANASVAQFGINATDVRINSTAAGTGSVLPVTFYVGGSERMRLDTSGNLGIGTASPGSRLHVYDATTANFNLQGDGATSIVPTRSSTDTSAPSLNLRKARGTTASPTAVATGDNLGSVVFTAYGGSNYRQIAAIFGGVETYTSDTDISSFLTFSTTPAGSVTRAERMRIDSSGNVGIGTTSAGGFNGTVNLGGSGSPTSGYLEGWGNAQSIPSSVTTRFDGFFSVATTAAASFTLPELRHFTAQGGTKGAGSTVTSQFGFYADSGLTTATNNYGFYSNIASGSNRWNFYAAGTAQNYFAGLTTIGTTNGDPVGNNVAGGALFADGRIQASATSQTGLFVNRKTDDGALVAFYQDGTQEGTISVAGNTISYNPFMGSHYTEIVGAMPTLKGTVLESLDELVDGKYSNQDRLPKAKISDTAGSSSVYGVYFSPDSDPDTNDGILAAALGASWVRIAAGVTVQRGDLLESNGDGCAKVQSDDIIRSKTIGKVTSTTVADTYADGSYIVPCVLYCG